MKKDNIFNTKIRLRLNKIMFSRPIGRLRSDQLRSSGQAPPYRKMKALLYFNGILCSCPQNNKKKGKESMEQNK